MIFNRVGPPFKLLSVTVSAVMSIWVNAFLFSVQLFIKFSHELRFSVLMFDNALMDFLIGFSFQTKGRNVV